MSDATFFPKDEIEALTLLYLQNLNLSGLAPEEIFEKYQDAYQRISAVKNAEKEDSLDNY